MNCASTDLKQPAGEADQKRGSVTDDILRAVAAAAGSTPTFCSAMGVAQYEADLGVVSKAIADPASKGRTNT
jgi:hypothetical protein